MNNKQYFDLLCIFTDEDDQEFKEALKWINDTAFKEGISTYEMVNKILRVKKAGNKIILN